MKFTMFNFRFARTLFFIACLLGVSLSAHAQQKITATITVTNLTTNGMVFTLNGDTRTFTNNVVNSLTQVLTNSDATGCGSKTNLLTQIRLAPFAQVVSVDRGSNSFNLVGNSGVAMALTLTAGYASVSYSTQTLANLVAVQVPVASLPTAQARTNAASGVAAALNAIENTNPIVQTTIAAGQLLGTSNTQTVVGPKTFTSPTGVWWGGVSNAFIIIGNLGNLTNGSLYGPALLTAALTNAIFISGNLGNLTNGGIYNPSIFSGMLTNVHITGATATNLTTKSSGVSIKSIDVLDVSGSEKFYVTDEGAHFPTVPVADVDQLAGFDSGNNEQISAISSYSIVDSVLVGNGNGLTNLNAATLAGTIPSTNLTGVTILNGGFPGKEIFTNASVSFGHISITTLASGNNAGIVVGTNVVAFVSGPAGSFTNCGILSGLDGQIIVIKNKTGQSMTFANQSGVDPLPANRIRTGIGSDVTVTNNPGIVTLIYDGTDSRWDILSHN